MELFHRSSWDAVTTGDGESGLVANDPVQSRFKAEKMIVLLLRDNLSVRQLVNKSELR